MRPLNKFAVVVLAALAGPSTAQNSGLGIKGGVLMGTLASEVQRTTWVPGGTLGLYAPVAIGTRMELQPELLLTTTGAGFTRPDGQGYDVRVVYANVPVSVKFFMNNRLNFGAGAQFGHRILAQRTDASGTSDVSDRFESMDLGLITAAAYDFDSGVDLTLRAYWGTTPVLREDDVLFPRNRSVQFTAGYRLVNVSRVSMVRRRL